MKRAFAIVCAAMPLAGPAPAHAGDWKQQVLSAEAPYIDRANDQRTRAILTGSRARSRFDS
jgi:hypothetical protein